MAAVLEFRPQSMRASGATALRPEVGQGRCEIVIFPGVRRERRLELAGDAERSAGPARNAPDDSH